MCLVVSSFYFASGKVLREKFHVHDAIFLLRISFFVSLWAGGDGGGDGSGFWCAIFKISFSSLKKFVFRFIRK